MDGILLASSKYGKRQLVIDELAGGLEPIRNGEISSMNSKFVSVNVGWNLYLFYFVSAQSQKYETQKNICAHKSNKILVPTNLFILFDLFCLSFRKSLFSLTFVLVLFSFQVVFALLASFSV